MGLCVLEVTFYCEQKTHVTLFRECVCGCEKSAGTVGDRGLEKKVILSHHLSTLQGLYPFRIDPLNLTINLLGLVFFVQPHVQLGHK